MGRMILTKEVVASLKGKSVTYIKPDPRACRGEILSSI
jgi:hypothetical protein